MVKNIRYLSVEQVKELHEQVIGRTGGASGILNEAVLESAVNRPKAAIGHEELYPSLLEKAAALLHSLISNHPFVDGNKRTAFMAMQEFLRLNRYRFDVDTESALEMMLGIAVGEVNFREIVVWIEQHAKEENV